MLRPRFGLLLLSACAHGDPMSDPDGPGAASLALRRCVGALPVEILEFRGLPETVTVGEPSPPIVVVPRDLDEHELVLRASGATVREEADPHTFRLTALEPGPLSVVVGIHDGCTYDVATITTWAEPGPTVAASLLNLLSVPVEAHLEAGEGTPWEGTPGLSTREQVPRGAGVGVRSAAGGEASVTLPDARRATVVVHGPPDAPTTRVLADEVAAPEAGRVALRAFHGVADLGTIDIVDLDSGDVLFPSLARGREAAAAGDLSPGPIRLGVDVDRDGNSDLDIPSFSAAAGEVLRVGVTRSPDGAIHAAVQAVLTDPLLHVARDGVVLPAGGELVSWVDVARCDRILDVGVGVGLDHPAGGGVAITLRGPGGETLLLQAGDHPDRAALDPWFLGGRVASPAAAGGASLLGRSGAGRWTLALQDLHGVEAGVLSGFTLALRCGEGP